MQLHSHLKKCDLKVAGDMKETVSIDYIFPGTDTEEEATKYYEEVVSAIVQAAFNLRFWASNSPSL